MHVTAKADYAVRAVIELAGSSQGSPRKVDEVAQAQGIPVSFLENILTQLRSSGIMLTKNEEWCYERELRKLFRLDDVKKRRITDRNTGKKRDWFFSQVPAEAIVTVLLGVHSAQGLRKKVEGLLQGCLSHVKLCKGELHRGEFRLSFD